MQYLHPSLSTTRQRKTLIRNNEEFGVLSVISDCWGIGLISSSFHVAAEPGGGGMNKRKPQAISPP